MALEHLMAILELQQRLDEKLVQKDYAGAAILQKHLKEDAMPHRSEGDDCPACARCWRAAYKL